jgi:long-chain fatty acid transport protein
MKRQILIAVSLLASVVVSGNGYKILCVRSAKATAMGEAFIAQADDATAVAFNPAGLADLRGVHLSLQGTWCNAFTERKAPDGGTTDMVDKWQVVPSLFATWDMGTERMTLGVGVSVPNGLSSEWKANSFAGPAGYYSDLFIADYTIALGYRVTERLSVGVGVDFYASELDQRYNVPGVGAVSVDGDGTAWGFNVGLRYKFNERHSIAATYRKAFTIDYDGDFYFENVGTFDMETSIDYPGSVVLGYAFRPNEKWTFEADLDWTHWSQVGDMSVDVPTFPDPSYRHLPVNRDYRNTLAYKFGVQYQYSEALALRAGYIYNQNATAEAVWSPTQPDTDMHFFTCGFGYDVTENVTVESALQLVYYEKRTIENTVGNDFGGTVNGTYRTWAPCITLGLACHF